MNAMKANVEMKQGPVTIYSRSEWGMGVRKTEARAFGFAVVAYAQYPSAVECHFVGKGQRKVRGFVQTSTASLLVLEGHGHPDPDTGDIVLSETPTMRVTKGRYMSQDPRWQSDFDAMIDAYIAEKQPTVVADYRRHNPYTPPDMCACCRRAPAVVSQSGRSPRCERCASEPRTIAEPSCDVAVFVSDNYACALDVPAGDRSPAEALAEWFQGLGNNGTAEAMDIGDGFVLVRGQFPVTEGFDFDGLFPSIEAARRRFLTTHVVYLER